MQFTDAKSDAHKLARRVKIGEGKKTTSLPRFDKDLLHGVMDAPCPMRMWFNLAEWKGNKTGANTVQHAAI